LSDSTVKTPAIGECKCCLRRRKSVVSATMICTTCYLKEPKDKCTVCGKEKRFVMDGGGVCPKCIRRSASPADIECTRCGEKKTPAKRGGEYCKPCQKKISFGSGICSGCGKHKPYEHKRDRLCLMCKKNRYAPRLLRSFLLRVRISNKYNDRLFRWLTEMINWEKVDHNTYSRLVRFGRFLQGHTFEGPLTWEAILKLKTSLPGEKFQGVRWCLNQLGDLLLDPVVDETFEMAKKRLWQPLASISQIPSDEFAIMQKYDFWLRTERKVTSSLRRGYFQRLADFWRWAIRRGLTSFTKVDGAHVEEYLYTVGLKWRCRSCASTKNLDTRGETSPTACENLNCREPHSYEKVIRCREVTVQNYHSQFRSFFGWLKDVEEAIEINPAPPLMKNKRRKGRRTTKRLSTIQYYDWGLIEPLLNAIPSSDIPAEEGMVLYLVLYLGFSLLELKTVRIPPQCRPTALGSESREPLENILSLEWRPRELSRGKQSPGRTGEILRLEPSDEPWLRDLVRRFVRERNQRLRNPNYPYLFVAANRTFQREHVSSDYFHRVIESATARITGRVCNISTLTKSSRLLHSEFGGYEGAHHLEKLGLGKRQAQNYAWAHRVKVVPRKANQPREMVRDINRV
jgi:hypothetical protein